MLFPLPQYSLPCSLPNSFLPLSDLGFTVTFLEKPPLTPPQTKSPPPPPPSSPSMHLARFKVACLSDLLPSGYLHPRWVSMKMGEHQCLAHEESKLNFLFSLHPTQQPPPTFPFACAVPSAQTHCSLSFSLADSHGVSVSCHFLLTIFQVLL